MVGRSSESVFIEIVKDRLLLTSYPNFEIRVYIGGANRNTRIVLIEQRCGFPNVNRAFAYCDKKKTLQSALELLGRLGKWVSGIKPCQTNN